jgi:DNA-binding NarL/FixJ family response regulator
MSQVLIVDDEPMVCAGLEKLLTRDGNDVRVVNSLREGKLAIAWGVLDILPMWHVAIIDLELQGSIDDGCELLRLLPVCVVPIVLSGHDIAAMRDRVEHPSALGGGLWIQKPPVDIDMRNLRAMVKAAGRT